MAQVYERLLERLFPEFCPRCASAARCGYCSECRGEFLRVPDPCPRCALARPAARCPASSPRWRLDAVVAPYEYAAPLARELVGLKAPQGRRLGRPLGLLLAEHVGHAALRIDAVVPVPLHAARLRERGFNQAAEIARVLARRCRLRLALDGAARLRPTALQAGLGVAARSVNLEHAFRAGANVAGASIAIVDDVMTTGATANALAAALCAAGAVRVEAWAVARTHPPRQPARNV